MKEIKVKDIPKKGTLKEFDKNIYKLTTITISDTKEGNTGKMATFVWESVIREFIEKKKVKFPGDIGIKRLVDLLESKDIPGDITEQFIIMETYEDV